MTQYLYYSITERDTNLIEVNSSFEELYQKAKDSTLENVRKYFGEDSFEYKEMIELFKEAEGTKDKVFSMPSDDFNRGFTLTMSKEYNCFNYWSNDRDTFDIYIEQLPQT